MFRIWGKLFKDNRMIRDYTYCEESKDSRTHKVFKALEAICYEFDLEKPIWLDINVSEFRKGGKTRFRQDSFIEQPDFDYLEFQVIEED